jgi:hypothetical protein
MIISDEYRFVFVHIPKCAGTYIRNILMPYDSTMGEFTNRVAVHPELGLIDFVHIPLNILETNFQNEYHKIELYESFVVLRNPFDRFKSSFVQHLKQMGGKRIEQMTMAESNDALKNAMEWIRLNRDNTIYPHEYIHFIPQIRFVNNHQKRVIKNIFCLEHIDEMIVSIEEIIGDKLKLSHQIEKNQTYLYRNSIFRYFFEIFRPMYKTLYHNLPRGFVNFIISMVFVTKDENLQKLFKSDYVIEFVNANYAEDISLYEQTMANNSSKKVHV